MATTTTDRIERFAAKINRRLMKDEASSTTMRVATRSRLSVILRECGFEKRGQRNMALVQAALAEWYVYPQVDLTDLALPLDQIVYFSRTPPASNGGRRFQLPRHVDLQRFIVENFDLVFPDLRLVKIEMELATGDKADIVARDTTTGEWVVIELKPGHADKAIGDQIVRYMDAVRERPPRKRGDNGQVRGIIVTGQHDPALHQRVSMAAEASGYQVEWLVYRVEMALERAEARPSTTAAW